MATIQSAHYAVDRILDARMFRNARCYAPDAVVAVLRDVVAVPELALIVDVDALERSARARIDRVMIVALELLARDGVQIVFVARQQQDRAAVLQRSVPGSFCAPSSESVVAQVRRQHPACRFIAISDDPSLLAGLTSEDRGMVLGSPELAGAIRASLWWLLDARTRATPT